jgi:hypothetical protein
MMERRGQQLSIHGTARMTSPWFSPAWRLVDWQGVTVAEMRRYPRMHVSTVHFTDGTAWILEPEGWGVVRALDVERNEVGRVTRQSWMGRRWQITAPQWAYDLVSDPIPRRWHLAVGGATIATISGSLVSYNSVTVATVLAVPAAAVILAWHVIARPWEAAAAPRGLVPAPSRVITRPVQGAA